MPDGVSESRKCYHGGMETHDDGTGNGGKRAWYDPACHECVMDADNPNGTETTAALEGIASRFGDGMAVAAHKAIHDYDRVRDGIGLLGAGRDVDAAAPAFDGDTLRSLIRLFGIMSDTPTKPLDGKSLHRMARCRSMIMAAGDTTRHETGHDTAQRYAAAAIIHPERQVIDTMHPLIGLDDISAFLEQVEHMHLGDWIDVWMADIHEHLPALVRMHMDGASTDELAAITGLLMSEGSPMMETVSEYGDRAQVSAARAVLRLHETMRRGRREADQTGWTGRMDTDGIPCGTVAAMAEAATRVCAGTAADPGTEDGRAAMGRAVSALADAASGFIAPEQPITLLGCANRMIDRSLAYAARTVRDDTAAMDMLMRIAHTGRMIDDGREYSLIGPVLGTGERGVAAMAEAAILDTEGMPKGFITETLLAVVEDTRPTA